MDRMIIVKRELLIAMKQLRYSIDDAMNNMVKTYGENHPAICRLRSYYPALDKQLEYANRLSATLAKTDPDEYASLIAKIQAISDMIRFDAKSLLSSLMTGKDIIPESDCLN